MKISMISTGEDVEDTATMTTAFMMQRNVTLQLEAAEHKDVIFCPFELTDLLLWQSGQNLFIN